VYSVRASTEVWFTRRRLYDTSRRWKAVSIEEHGAPNVHMLGTHTGLQAGTGNDRRQWKMIVELILAWCNGQQVLLFALLWVEEAYTCSWRVPFRIACCSTQSRMTHGSIIASRRCFRRIGPPSVTTHSLMVKRQCLVEQQPDQSFTLYQECPDHFPGHSCYIILQNSQLSSAHYGDRSIMVHFPRALSPSRWVCF
jgi:hypothetical protein